ncbi:MAG: hypothetical protein IOC64_11810 [Methylobacterium sp.]|nr:hypothetical protein [Methylobacterium sp.]MCA3607714.1 hypothetical protein [Methylobacterium sp.]MCA3609110.1 hypothetical protein [Methylobacterium sp.]MCA3618801.1 hypothetical protein [Methylobacterium sp.]MCA3621039.1 hypothetical protein [Methylobacterium sp.]
MQNKRNSRPVFYDHRQNFTLSSIAISLLFGLSGPVFADFLGNYTGKITYKSRPQPTMCPDVAAQLVVSGDSVMVKVPQSGSSYQGQVMSNGSFSYSGRSSIGAKITGSGSIKGKLRE